MLPNFLIIGAPRAGTSWIARNIRTHPDIYMPKKKELHFFDWDYDKGMSYYEDCFKNHKKEKAIGEATPSYLFVESVPELIHEHVPDAKLILSLRNPVERLYSRFWNSKAAYSENKDLSFEEKIKLKPQFIEEGYYYDHLQRFYKYFAHDKILILLFDDLKKEPQKFLKEIYEYLEVDSTYVSPLINQKTNAASLKKTLSKSEALWYVTGLAKKLKFLKLSNYLARRNEGALPPMNPKTKEWLIKEVYYEKNRLLSKLINRDLSAWNKI